MLTDSQIRTLAETALADESEVTRDLSKSIAARALASAGDLLGAIDRKCLADTVGLWRRLCILAEWPQLERIALDACFPMADEWQDVPRDPAHEHELPDPALGDPWRFSR